VRQATAVEKGGLRMIPKKTQILLVLEALTLGQRILHFFAAAKVGETGSASRSDFGDIRR